MLGSQGRTSIGSHSYCAIAYVYLSSTLYSDIFQCAVRPNAATQYYDGSATDVNATISLDSNKTTWYTYFKESDESGDCGIICLDI
ncbi:MAG: hypothetical protein LBD75_06890 [Candidatus Peribacteria bacterium]|jgi:hypothetical protein|nr:hypothetical protein [Candidatus Peribacteria bacterium]